MKASAFALIGAVLTYFGVTPSVVLAYLVTAGGPYALTKTDENVSNSAHEDHMHAAPAE